MDHANHPHDASLCIIPPRAPAAEGAATLRVRYCECDPMGVAHHAAYIPWLEIGRTELLRASGVSYAQLEAAGVFLVITKLDVKYRRPVLYDDLVEIRSRWVGGSKVKIEHTYEIFITERTATPKGTPSGAAPPPFIPHTAAIAATTLACIGHDARPRALPDWLMTP